MDNLYKFRQRSSPSPLSLEASSRCCSQTITQILLETTFQLYVLYFQTEYCSVFCQLFRAHLAVKVCKKVLTWSRKNISQKFYVDINRNWCCFRIFAQRVIQIKIEGRELSYTIFYRWKIPSFAHFYLANFLAGRLEANLKAQSTHG